MVVDVGNASQALGDASILVGCDAGACSVGLCSTGMQCAGSCLATDAYRQVFADGSEPVDWALYDGNGDGFDDLLTVDLATEVLSFHAGDGVGGFGPVVTVPVGRTQFGLSLADFTGDGILDVVLRQPDFRRARLLVGGPAGPSVRADVALASDAYRTIPHDADGDGAIDLVVVRSEAGCLEVLRNDGQGTLGASPVACIPEPDGVAWRWAQRGVDVDGDGRAEVVGIPTMAGRMIAFDLELGTASIREVARWAVPTSAAQPVVSDVLPAPGLELVTLPFAGDLDALVFEARVDASSASCAGVRVPSRLTPLAAGDVDRDGLPDFLSLSPSSARLVVSRSRSVPPVLE